MGAYFQLLTPGIPELGGWVYMGPYDLQAYWYEFTGVITNTTPTDAYRGAGRPEATYVLERLVDAYARKIGKDPAEVRRMNFHPPFDEATDGDLRAERRLGQLRAGARPRAGAGRVRRGPQGAAGPPRQRGHAAARHRALHLHRDVRPGAVEHPGRAAVRGRRLGRVRRSSACPPARWSLKIGTSPHGQGHETTWSQIVADGARRHAGRRRGAARRHAVAPLGMDTYGSRSVSVGGVALHFAMEKIKEKARKIAAHELEVAEDDLEYADDAFRVKGAPGQGAHDPRARVLRVARARPAGRDRAEPGGDRGLRPAELHVAVGHAHLRGRGGHARPAPPTS